MNYKIAVITPTMGDAKLKRAMESVQAQTVAKDIFHLIVGDGPNVFSKLFDKSLGLPLSFKGAGVQFTFAPINTGAGGFYGHRIYAAYPHLIDAEYIAFLDEDNWWEPNHIESCLQNMNFHTINKVPDVDFVYSLRNVYIDDQLLAEDKCESIGQWPIWFTQDRPEKDYLVDTSSYFFRRKWLIENSQLWHSGWGGDRRFFKAVKDVAKYRTTGLHTLNYLLPDINKAYGGDLKFFEKGNEAIKQKYGDYPWTK